MLIASSCNSIEDTPANVSRLQVSVTNTTPESRAIVTGTTLPVDAQIGVTLLDAAGQNYDDTPYANLKYTTANGTDWAISGADAPLLTATDGKAIAYYPWIDGADYTALAVETASQTDYMYSGWVEDINNAAPQANFNMKHGLSAFRVILKKDANYKTDATATTVNIKSDAFVASAKMSAVDGTLSAWTGNGDVTVDMDDITLSTSDQYTDIMVVPAQAAGTKATFTVAVEDAGSNSKNYTVDVPFTTAMLQGKCYQFTLTLTATGFEASTVAVTEWGQVTNAGSGNLAPEIPNDLLVGTIDLTTAANGVYAVAQNGKGVTVDDADESCIAVALIVTDAPTPQRFWIEKNEDSNTSYAIANENYESDMDDNSKFAWGGFGTDQPNITNFETSGTVTNTNWSEWTEGALSDFNGKTNSEVIKNILNNGSGNNNYTPAGVLLETFNDLSNTGNCNFTNWYVPTVGQLYLVFLNKSIINTALTNIGGTKILSSGYWSSSEKGLNHAWYVDMSYGSVYEYSKSSGRRIRLIRDIE